jgi:DNA invertase Pin-like site-specific DNA recombinase
MKEKSIEAASSIIDARPWHPTERKEPSQVPATNGVIYCRVSSKEQIEGTSLESQEAACREYARQHSIKVLKTFVERGESAKFADRTQLIELIDFCRESKDKIQSLLVWKVDRFARNVGDHFHIKATLLKHGVRVVSVTEPIDANPEGNLMETILAGFAQFDNDIRATRTVQGMRRKIQEGIFPWKPPLGYRSALREGTKKMAPDEPDQPVFGLLQKAWRAFATGEYTKAEIRRLLQSWGVLTENDISMTSQSIDNMFRNKYYAGILVDPWSNEEHMGAHVAMVSLEEFTLVQTAVTRRNRSLPHQRDRLEFPLRGVARCGSCRRYLTGGFSKGRSRHYAYYSCGNRECEGRESYPVNVVNEEFEAFLNQIAPKPGITETLGTRVVIIAQKSQTAWSARRVKRDSEIKRLRTQISELIRMKANGLLTDEEFVEQKSSIHKRQASLEDLSLPDCADPREIRSAVDEITKPLSALSETWKTLPTPFRRRFNRLVVPAGFVIGESRTAELGLLFRLLGQLGEENSHGVPPTGKSLNRIMEEIRAFAELFGSVREVKKAA